MVAALGFVLALSGSSASGRRCRPSGAIVAIVGAAFAGAGWWLRRGDRLQRQLRDVEVDRRLRGRSDIEQELKTVQGDRDKELEGLGVDVTAEAEERLDAEEAHVAEIEQRRARLGGLIGEEPRDLLPDKRDAAALEIEQKTSALDALGPIAKEPRARERLEVEVADAERQLERARDDESDARARVEQNPVDAEEVAGLAERLAGWQEELEVLKRRERVYARTLREINAAEQATMQRATRYLERRMVGDIARVTDGRYKRVRVDDADLGHRCVLAGAQRLGPGHDALAGHAGRRVPRGPARARPARDRRPPAAAGPRRPVRDPRRRARHAGLRAARARSPPTSR